MSTVPTLPPQTPPLGRQPDEPDTSPLLPPPRAAARPRGLGWSQEEAPPDSSGSTRASINDLTSKMAAYGAGIKIQVKRLEPKLPPCESGWTNWIEIPNPTPTEDDIRSVLDETFGGGEFMIKFRSLNSQKPEEDILKLAYAGDWKPISDEGRAIKQLQIQRGGVMPNVQIQGASLAGETAPLLGKIIESAGESEREARRIASEAGTAQQNTLLELVKSMKPEPRQGTGMEGIAALVGAMVPLFTGLLESQRAAREAAEARAAEERRRADERFEKMLLAQQQAQTPTAMIESLQSASRIAEKRAAMEMDMLGGTAKKIMEKSVELALASKSGGEDPGVIRQALANLLESVGPTVAQMGMAMLPKIIGGGGQQQPQQAPQQLPRGGVMMQPGTSQAPVFLPPPPPQAMVQQPPPPPPPVQAPPAAVPAPDPEPSAQPPAIDDAIQQARLRAEQCASIILHHIRVSAQQRPDPATAWVMPYENTTIEVVYGMAPESFRQAIEAIDPVAGPIRPIEWVAGLGPFPTQIATVLQTECDNPPIVAWIREFLDMGPWHEEDEGD